MVNKNKFYMVIAFLVGIMLGGIFFSTTEEAEIIKEECNYDDWRTLKEVDDRGFQLAGEGFGTFAEAVTAIIEEDEFRLELAIRDIEQNTENINQVGVEREEILRRLGY
jgi:hypothetical protein